MIKTINTIDNSCGEMCSGKNKDNKRVRFEGHLQTLHERWIQVDEITFCSVAGEPVNTPQAKCSSTWCLRVDPKSLGRYGIHMYTCTKRMY